MNSKKIKEFLFSIGEKEYRFAQIEKAVYGDFKKDFNSISQLPASLRQELDRNFSVFSFSVKKVKVSSSFDAHKAALVLNDSRIIESVLLARGAGKWAVCVSTQVGCPVGCAFCVTGRMGLKRNLSSEEIADQVLFWKMYAKEKSIGDIVSVVYMGMGEPFLNYENVADSIQTVNSKLNIGKRHISVSTFGHVPGIRRFAKDFPQVNLAISLHTASEQMRKKLMPFNQQYPLTQLSKAVTDYIDSTKRKVFIEYVMIDSLNDRSSDAARLIEWMNKTHKKRYFTVNLIPYNEARRRFSRSKPEKIANFEKLLMLANFEVTVRKSLGDDIEGACGQLAGR